VRFGVNRRFSSITCTRQSLLHQPELHYPLNVVKAVFRGCLITRIITIPFYEHLVEVLDPHGWLCMARSQGARGACWQQFCACFIVLWSGGSRPWYKHVENTYVESYVFSYCELQKSRCHRFMKHSTLDEAMLSKGTTKYSVFLKQISYRSLVL